MTAAGSPIYDDRMFTLRSAQAGQVEIVYNQGI